MVYSDMASTTDELPDDAKPFYEEEEGDMRQSDRQEAEDYALWIPFLNLVLCAVGVKFVSRRHFT
jgi:hypothetical protein